MYHGQLSRLKRFLCVSLRTADHIRHLDHLGFFTAAYHNRDRRILRHFCIRRRVLAHDLAFLVLIGRLSFIFNLHADAGIFQFCTRLFLCLAAQIRHFDHLLLILHESRATKEAGRIADQEQDKKSYDNPCHDHQDLHDPPGVIVYILFSPSAAVTITPVIIRIIIVVIIAAVIVVVIVIIIVIIVIGIISAPLYLVDLLRGHHDRTVIRIAPAADHHKVPVRINQRPLQIQQQ